MRAVLTTYDRVQLSFAQSLLQDAGIASVIQDGSLDVYDTLMWRASQLMVLADGDAEKAEHILQEGLADWPPQETPGG